MKRSLLLLILLALGAPPALSQGIDLSWNDCGQYGFTAKTFACNTNEGEPFTMFVSVFSSVEMPQFVGVEGRIDALVNAASLPPWWQMAAGQCRANALTASCDPAAFGITSCPDIWDGAQPITISDVTAGMVPNVVRVRFAAAVGVPSPITADEVGQELLVGAVRISRAKTVGAGACDGCLVGACFLLTEVKLMQTQGIGDQTLTYPAVNNIITFNGSAGPYNCYVPAANRTWGAIKTLYR